MFTEQSKIKKIGGVSGTVARKPTTQKIGLMSEENASVGLDSAGPKPFSSSSKGNTLKHQKLSVKGGDAVPAKKIASPCKTVDREVQVNLTEEELVTSDTPSPEYWKQLAEKREELILEMQSKMMAMESKNEELEVENTRLTEENGLLKQENVEMAEMVEQAKELANFIQELPDEISDEDD